VSGTGNGKRHAASGCLRVLGWVGSGLAGRALVIIDCPCPSRPFLPPLCHRLPILLLLLPLPLPLPTAMRCSLGSTKSWVVNSPPPPPPPASTYLIPRTGCHPSCLPACMRLMFVKGPPSVCVCVCGKGGRGEECECREEAYESNAVSRCVGEIESVARSQRESGW